MSQNDKRKRTLIHVVGVLLLAGALGVIIFSSLNEALYYFTVDEVRDRGDELLHERFRVKGNVVEGSLECVEGTVQCTFDIAHAGAVLTIHSDLALPDAFKEGAEVVVTGTLVSRERFDATEITANCPSKYESN